MLRVKKLTEDAQVPSYQSDGAAGLDLYSIENRQLDPHDGAIIKTGIAMAIPPGYVGVIHDRSSMAAERGIHTLAGVIDSDYRGEIGIVLYNTSAALSRRIHKGDRIAQILIVPCPQFTITTVDDLDETKRGDGGFGSTGK